MVSMVEVSYQLIVAPICPALAVADIRYGGLGAVGEAPAIVVALPDVVVVARGAGAAWVAATQPPLARVGGGGGVSPLESETKRQKV